jgi:hypothetical protein
MLRRPSCGVNFMPLRRPLIVAASAFVLSTSIGRAGPCSLAVGRVQAEVDAYLEVTAAAGRFAKESKRATMNRQPTPATIAAAEESVGDHGSAAAENAVRAMTRARNSDLAGDTSACEQALADEEHAIESTPTAAR